MRCSIDEPSNLVFGIEKEGILKLKMSDKFHILKKYVNYIHEKIVRARTICSVFPTIKIVPQ